MSDTQDIIAQLRRSLDPGPVCPIPDWVVRAAADRLAELDAAIHGLVDHEDQSCRFDHHGYCQDHPGGFGRNGCGIAIARKAVGLSHSRIAPPNE